MKQIILCVFLFAASVSSAAIPPLFGPPSFGKCEGLVSHIGNRPAEIFIDLSKVESTQDLERIIADAEGAMITFTFDMDESEKTKLLQSLHDFLNRSEAQIVRPKGGTPLKLGSEKFAVPEIRPVTGGHVIDYGNGLTFFIAD